MKYSEIRNTIKTLSNEQRELKKQRKTVNFKGERTVEPYTAVIRHDRNRYELRHLQMAYRILKGKNVIYPKKTTLYSQSKIDKMVEKYTLQPSKVI